jgi:hypothetical protein
MITETFKTDFLEKLVARRNYDIFGSHIHEDLHWGKMFIHLFGEYYSRYRMIQPIVHELFINSLIKRYHLEPDQIIRIEQSERNDFRKTDFQNSEILLLIKKGLCVGVYDDIIDIMYGSKITVVEREEIINHVNEYSIRITPIKKFFMIQYSGGFDLTDFNVKNFNINIDSHYNDDFQSVHRIITDSLNKKDKNGLILLHGKYGTGKTSYLRYLISNINRKFIYFPLNMIELLNSPEFLPFISKESNSVLILEDCESQIMHRENQASKGTALSNLLNIGDGLLSDALNINVICTFNAGLRKIDDAILRKGRLIARYEFKELEAVKAQALAKKIGRKTSIGNPMTLSDIYNLDEEDFELHKTSIGFKIA